MSENEKVRIPIEAALAEKLPFVDVRVRFIGTELEFVAILEDIDQRTMQEFQRTANESSRPGKINPAKLHKAMAQLFKKKFQRTNVDWQTYDGEGNVIGSQLADLGYETEREYFLRHEIGQRYLRAIVDGYFEVVNPRAAQPNIYQESI